MELALALPGVITTCVLIWMLKVVLDRQTEERKAHRTEVAHAARALGEMARAQRAELAGLAASYSADLAALHATHREQVDGLLQRIQAPQVAVSEHAAQHFPPDPIQPDLDDDLAQIQQREAALERLAMDLGS